MAVDRTPRAPPVGWTFIAGFSADSDNWRIEWLDAPGGNPMEKDPIVGFVFWKDANGNLRTDPITWYGPVFPETTTTPYRVHSPNGYELDPSETQPS